MAQRPGFPIKFSTQEKVAPAKAPAKKSATTNPQGLGLDSSAVRQRMVQKLAAQGLKDPKVLQAMGAVERHRFVESALVNKIENTPVRGYEIFAQDVTITKNGYYRTWIGLRLPLGKYNKMYNFTIEQAVDAYNLNGESKKAWDKLKKNNDDNNIQ